MNFEPLHKNDKVFVAGHKGLVGAALCRKLVAKGYRQLLQVDRASCDLTNSAEVDQLIGDEKPTAVLIAAAKVGGIRANDTERADFIFENSRISLNLIEYAHRHNVPKLIFLSSSCVYPKECPQPISEKDLLTGELEFTNRPYALAKIAAMEMVNAVNEQHGRGYYSILPCNLYGPGDNFDRERSHVIPGLIRKFMEAKRQGAPAVSIWGSGQAKREFMHVDDCASGIIQLAESLSKQVLFNIASDRQRFFHFNLGTSEEVSIRTLAALLQELTGYAGKIEFDTHRPDGVARRLLDSNRARQLGWQPSISLKEGLADLIDWAKLHHKDWAA